VELIAFTRAVHMAATVLVAGTFAFEIFVVPHGARHVDSTAAIPLQVARSLRSMRVAGVLLALISWAAWLAITAIDMSGLPAMEALRVDVLQTVLADTTFGHVWIVRLVLLTLLAALLDFTLTGACVAGAALAGLAWTGHAVAADWRHLAVDALHLLGAGLWLGTLLPLAWVLGRARHASEGPWKDFAVACIRRYSVSGVVAVSVLALTGLMNAFWLVREPGNMTATSYGQLLSVKLVLVALMIALAVVNRLVIVPELGAGRPGDDGQPIQHLARNARAELVLGVLIVAIVGALGIMAPPGSVN
jgi:putative copper resistance protein D